MGKSSFLQNHKYTLVNKEARTSFTACHVGFFSQRRRQTLDRKGFEKRFRRLYSNLVCGQGGFRFRPYKVIFFSKLFCRNASSYLHNCFAHWKVRIAHTNIETQKLQERPVLLKVSLFHYPMGNQSDLKMAHPKIERELDKWGALTSAASGLTSIPRAQAKMVTHTRWLDGNRAWQSAM